MSVASGENELETAVMQAEPSAGVQDENLVVLEASEDRVVHFVHVLAGGNCLCEVSFSNTFELNNVAANTGDPISSAVLAVIKDDGGPDHQRFDYTSGPPHWEAGEEISLHTNNFASGARDVRVVIGYEPVGEFQRDRLRNR